MLSERIAFVTAEKCVPSAKQQREIALHRGESRQRFVPARILEVANRRVHGLEPQFREKHVLPQLEPVGHATRQLARVADFLAGERNVPASRGMRPIAETRCVPWLAASTARSLHGKPPASSPSESRSPFKSAKEYARAVSYKSFSRASPVAPIVSTRVSTDVLTIQTVLAANLEQTHVALAVIQVPFQRRGHGHQSGRAQHARFFRQRIRQPRGLHAGRAEQRVALFGHVRDRQNFAIAETDQPLAQFASPAS